MARGKPDEQEIHQLQDVDVVTVGLVTEGANGEEFFLMKSKQMGGHMAEDLEKEGAKSEEGASLQGEEAGFWAKLTTIVREAMRGHADEAEKALDPAAEKAIKEAVGALIGAKSSLPPAAVKALQMLQGQMGASAAAGTGKDYGYPPAARGQGKDYGYPNPAAKSEEDDVAKAAIIPAAITEQLATLAKANEDLSARVVAAETAAETERATRELNELIAKAQSLGALPIKPEELAEQLQALGKSDLKRREWWEALLKTANQQLTDAGMFKEAGTSQAPVIKSLDQKVAEAIEKGQSPRDVLLGLDPKDAKVYLEQRQSEITGRK